MSYYLLRDKITFYLSVIWLYRWKLKKKDFLGIPLSDLIGYYLLAITGICLTLSMILLIQGERLVRLVGFKWSFASPFTWGFLIFFSYRTLRNRFTVFESYYLAFISAIAGGCYYEVLRGIPYWINSNFAPWNWTNLSIKKVFFFDFQVFSLPILVHLLINRFDYKPKKEILILVYGVLVWYFGGIQLDNFYHTLGSFAGNTWYSWVMRLPFALLIYTILEEVSKDG